MRGTAPLSDHYRVIIVGGGPAGTGTALALLGRGVSPVLVVEARDYSGHKIGESLLPDVQVPLGALGLPPSLLAQSHLRSPGNASSWGTRELGYSDFVCHPLGEGWHIDRNRFERDLALAARSRGAEICLECRFVGHSPSRETASRHVELFTIEGPRLVTADFLVDASGIRGRVAQEMGAKRTLHDRFLTVYGYFNLPGTSQVSDETLLEAGEYGWWYRARLPHDRLVAALACDGDTVRQKKLRDWRRWLDLLAGTSHVSRALAGAAFDPASFTSTPTVSSLRQPAGGRGWLAVGDAASSYDPLFARGVQKALESAVTAGEAIARYFSGDETGIDEFQARVRDEYRKHLEQRAHLYAQQQRWPGAGFWTRRRLASA